MNHQKPTVYWLSLIAPKMAMISYHFELVKFFRRRNFVLTRRNLVLSSVRIFVPLLCRCIPSLLYWSHLPWKGAQWTIYLKPSLLHHVLNFTLQISCLNCSWRSSNAEISSSDVLVFTVMLNCVNSLCRTTCPFIPMLLVQWSLITHPVLSECAQMHHWPQRQYTILESHLQPQKYLSVPVYLKSLSLLITGI